MKRHKSFYQFLLWLTNNEPTPGNWEVRFDIFFLLTIFCLELVGTIGFILSGNWYWASIIWIEGVWAWDAIRHNRTYIK